MVELYGALVARATWDLQLAGRKSILFVDNNAAKEAFIKGTSHNPHYREMLLTLEHIESKNRSWAWVARVPSSSNPADAPSRGVHDGIVADLGAKHIPCICPMTGADLQVYYCNSWWCISVPYSTVASSCYGVITFQYWWVWWCLSFGTYSMLQDPPAMVRGLGTKVSKGTVVWV